MDQQKRPVARNDVGVEVNRIREFLGGVPKELRAVAAEKLIGEIVGDDSFNHHEALGILVETMLTLHERSLWQ